MALGTTITNAAVAVNAHILAAKVTADRLEQLAHDQKYRVEPVTVSKIEDVIELLADAQKSLDEFAQMNGFKVS